MEAEDKLTNLIARGAKEITTIEDTIIKEVEGGNAASKNFILTWKSRKQP
jgi:hypothetical protein